MLKLIPNPTFKAPVKIRAPGGVETAVVFEFKHMTQTAFQAYIGSDEWKKQTNEQAVMAIACGWEGVDGEFSEESLKTLFQNYQGAPSAIVSTYVSELTAAKLGN